MRPAALSVERVRRRLRWARPAAAAALCGVVVAGLMFIEARPEVGGDGPSYLQQGWEMLPSWDASSALDWLSRIFRGEADAAIES